MKKSIKIFVLIGLFFLLQGRAVQAEKISIAVDQTIFSFNANPDSTNEIKFKIKNLSSEMQNIAVVPEDFVAGDNNSILNTTEKNEQFGMKDWISSPEKNYALEPKETREISLLISVPKNATVGAHYAIANIQAIPQVDGQNFQNTIVGGQIGVYILLNVNGDVSGSGNLNQFKAPIIANKDVSLKADFENTGNILYIPHGEIQIDNVLTHKKTTVEMEKHFVFPGTKYSFESTWNAPSVLGVYKAQANFIDADGNNHSQRRWIFGKLSFLVPLLLLAIINSIFVIRKKVRKKKQK